MEETNNCFFNQDLNLHIDFEKYDIISFDIFDTLLIRTFLLNDDIWKYIEDKYDAKNFYFFRKNADKGGFYNINDAYNLMPSEYQKFKDIEIQLEISTIQKNPFNVDVFNKAKQLGKTIIIASDMYLTEDIIQKMLEKNGIIGYDKLYVSCCKKCRKDNGSMFQLIINEFKNKRILHIGDNSYSDYLIPQKFDIDSILVKNIKNEFIKNNPFIQDDFLKDDVYSRYIVSNIIIQYFICMHNNQNFNFWHEVACMIGIPLVTSYSLFILSEIKKNNINSLLFIARDGYILNEIFKKLNIPNLKLNYVYAPRILNNENNNNDIIQYNSYIKKLQISEYNNAIIDTVSASFTSKKLISNALNKDIYLILFKELYHNINGNSYLDENDHIFWCHLIEFIFMAPFLPTIKIKNNQPIYIKTVNQYEIDKINIYKNYMINILLSSINIINNMKILDQTIKNNFILNYINILIQNIPLYFLNKLKNIKNGCDIYHQFYANLF